MIEFISRLPQGYQEVEYIESSGTQYIDTGFMPNQDTRVVCDIDYTLTAATAWLFGARTSNEVKTYNVLTYSSKYRSDYNNKTIDCISHVNPTGRFVLDKNKNITYFDNVVGVSMTYAAFQCDYTLYLFANNEAGTAASHGTFKLYSCQIYDNGTLVRDFVPCYRKSDNVAGLYDLVNNVFYTNVGSGVFAVGANSNKHASAIITPGGVISFSAALRRRMMIKCDSKIEFEYTGNYTDNRDENGIGTVRFTSSGTLTVLSGKATVSAYILGAGGGGAVNTYKSDRRSGGGGGNQTIEVELTPGTYDIVIGSGGASNKSGTTAGTVPTAGSGGDTTAFGVTSTGGTGANHSSTAAPGGTPNGGNGNRSYKNGYAHAGSAAGGSPNGGASNSGNNVYAGGDGYVEITFS